MTSASAVHVDLSTRLHHLPRTLRLESQRTDVLVDIVRAAHETLEPRRVADWLAGQLQAWLPLACWAVLEDDLMGPPRVLAVATGAVPRPEASRGTAGATGSSASGHPLVREGLLVSVASRVIRLGEELVTANLQDHLVSAPPVAAIALPLVARRAVIGAVVGLAEERAETEPVLGDEVRQVLALAVEPGSIALDNARRMAQAEALSVTDDLTRLYNGRFLRQVLTREVKRAARTRGPLSLLFIDVDGFKAVNDSYGHLAGSRTLVELSGLLRGCARETDMVARYGGDEFALVLPDTPAAGARAVAERIRERVSGHPFMVAAGATVRLTVSVGVITRDAESPGEPQREPLAAADLLQAADAAMYWVKEHGKNGIKAVGS